MMCDKTGKIWLSRGAELLVIRPEPVESLKDPAPMQISELKVTATHDLVPGKEVVFPRSGGDAIEYKNDEVIGRWAAKRIFQTSDGDVWVSAENTLLQFSGSTTRLHTDADGLPTVMARMAEDAAGNLWVGGHSGLARIDRNGMTSYGQQDGLNSSRFFSINESTDGRLFFGQRGFYWSVFDGRGFKTVRPAVSDAANPLWTSRFAFLSRSGELWMLSSEGLYRFDTGTEVAGLAGRSASKKYGVTDGLKSNAAFQIFEDFGGDIWVSTRGTSNKGHGVARLRKGDESFHHFGVEDGLPEGKSAASYAEDQFGNIWIGFYEGGLVRFDGERFQVFSKENGLPENGHVADIHVDRKGRLWLATSVQGLFRVEDETSTAPRFQPVMIESGNVSNNIRTLTEDRFGRLYLGTARGVDRYSPETGYVKHYAVSDGLAADFVVDSHCDRNGDVWFATNDGISRLRPLPDEKTAPPRVFISGLRIAGAVQPVSNLGNISIVKGDLDHSENNLQVEYLGLDFRAGETLRFQYKLEGADAEWSTPSESRTVTFANLRPAEYRFLVRAVNSEGLISETPASVSFTIVAPVWQRTWFVILLALAVAGITAFVFWYRTARLREINEALREAKIAEEKLRRSREDRIADLEKVRARIATDLHDDIGSSLTQIAILSEVAQAQSNGGNGNAAGPLTKISEVSNELVGTMSDIVWSINPSKDHVSDLTQRMRRFAADVFSTKEIQFQFLAPGDGGETIVSSNIRREVFLIFKETVNNVLKHSGAKNVRIEIAIESGELIYRIADDGVGFDPNHPAPSSGGHGITGMRRRVEGLNGKLQIISEPGTGTTVSLTLPLNESSTI